MRLKGNGLGAARAHLYYIQRDGVTRTGDRGAVYSATEDRASGREFLDRCKNDRHQFRIMTSALDGDNYEELAPLIRRFMARVEDDLDTRLDWIAADHADTAYPHTHIMLRGRDDRGQNLIITPSYLNYGMRERFAGIVSLDLGPVTETGLGQSRRAEVEAEQVTSLDRRLLRERDENGAIAVPSASMVEHSIFTGRLHKLGALGLAAPLSGGRWHVVDELEDRLHNLGRRAQMASTLQQQLGDAGMVRAPTERVIDDATPGLDISGMLVAGGLVAGGSERHYLIVDAVDGRSHYVETSNEGRNASFSTGAILRLTVPKEGAQRSGEPSVHVELLSPIPLHELPHYDGATLLDRELVSPRLTPRDLGFGRELRAAIVERANWLIENGLASTSIAGLTCRTDMISLLERRDLARTAKTLARETGLVLATLEEGHRFEGAVRRRMDLASGCYAMIDNGHAFTLVPWEPALERALGKAVRATASTSGIAWTLCRGREIDF